MPFPSLCRICHRWPSTVICSDCLRAFVRPTMRCTRCAMTLPNATETPHPSLCGHCLRHDSPLQQCVAAVDYRYPWNMLIADLKFQEDSALATHLASLLLAQPRALCLLDACDLLIPMPLSVQRLRERGFNQAQRIAHHLAPGKVDSASLLRIRHTKAQSECALGERMRNVRHAFAADPMRIDKLKGQHLLLVDDVMTTGASLTEAAQTLLRTGAASVSAIVVARTPAHRSTLEP